MFHPVFLWALWERSRRGRAEGWWDALAVSSELSGPAAGDKRDERERQEGRVLAWAEGVSCYHSFWKGRVVLLGLIFQSPILSSGIMVETALW